MGVGIEAGLFMDLHPVAVVWVDDEDEVLVAVLGEAQEGGAAKLGGFGPGRGLHGALVSAPFEVGAMAGVDEIDGIRGEVGEVEPVEMVGAQLEHGADFFAVEVEDFEASVLEDAGQ